MTRNRLSIGHSLAGLLIGFEVNLNRFSSGPLGRFDIRSVGRDRQGGHLHRKSCLCLFQHDQKSHHLISSRIFLTLSTARPTGTSFCGCTMVTINRLAGCFEVLMVSLHAGRPPSKFFGQLDQLPACVSLGHESSCNFILP
jgi:hypothetical protein